MANVTQAFVWTNGVVATAVNMNANPAAFVAAFKNIDNTNVGAAGFFPSQLIPLNSAQATFGGTVGYTIVPGNASVVPLTISGVALQSSDIFDVTLTSGGNKVFSIQSNGIAYFSALATPSIAGSAIGDAVFQRTAGTGAIVLGGFSGSAFLDYGITNGGFLSASKPLAVNGQLSVLNQVYADGSSGGAPEGVHGGTGGTGLVVQSHATGNTAFFFDSLPASGPALFATFSKNNLSTSIATINYTSGVYTATSDARRKTNVQGLTYGLDTVLALKPSSFDWIDGNLHDIGFIAQEVQKLVPEIVSQMSDKDETLGLNYSGFAPVFAKAIQDLTAEFRAYVSAHP